MTIQYNEFAMAPSALPAPYMDNNGNLKYDEYHSEPSDEAANSNFPAQSRQNVISTLQATSYGHATAPNAQFNPSSNFDIYAPQPKQLSIPTAEAVPYGKSVNPLTPFSSNQHIDDDIFNQQMSQSLVPKENTVPRLIATSSGSSVGSSFSSGTSSPNRTASAITADERRHEMDQQLSLYEQSQQQRPTSTSTTMVTREHSYQNNSISPGEDPLAKKKRRRARNRVRAAASASGGAILGAVVLGPVGMVLGGYGAAKVTQIASKRGERKKDEKVTQEQLRRVPKPRINGELL
eukprot:CAMPEP_0195507020 /NCGR_PEP_ID=MMETSP0794_2-20130614/547_1 /TAXON_ID=515487 /ORGANISM="Stephanopyxis turris, Strain CCMP 815" /LENGTH=291 /DNA_ID=CAMNT_0040633551 /DNA_START=20 /DNA_END=895 /DNA_ORIENTATION=+